MEQKQKTILGIVVFALAIAGALVAYTVLSGREGATPDNFVAFTTPPTETITEATTEAITEATTAPPTETTAESVTEPTAEPTTEAPTETPTAAQGEQAPNFSFTNDYGQEFTLSDFLGEPVIVNFWASWCPSCVRESPYFEEFYQNHGQEVNLLKINLLDGRRETRETLEAFMENGGYTYPLFFDIDGTAAFGIRHIPVTFFINAEGYIVGRQQGAADANALAQGLALILQ